MKNTLLFYLTIPYGITRLIVDYIYQIRHNDVDDEIEQKRLTNQSKRFIYKNKLYQRSIAQNIQWIWHFRNEFENMQIKFSLNDEKNDNCYETCGTKLFSEERQTAVFDNISCDDHYDPTICNMNFWWLCIQEQHHDVIDNNHAMFLVNAMYPTFLHHEISFKNRESHESKKQFIHKLKNMVVNNNNDDCYRFLLIIEKFKNNKLKRKNYCSWFFRTKVIFVQPKIISNITELNEIIQIYFNQELIDLFYSIPFYKHHNNMKIGRRQQHTDCNSFNSLMQQENHSEPKTFSTNFQPYVLYVDHLTYIGFFEIKSSFEECKLYYISPQKSMTVNNNNNSSLFCIIRMSNVVSSFLIFLQQIQSIYWSKQTLFFVPMILKFDGRTDEWSMISLLLT